MDSVASLTYRDHFTCICTNNRAIGYCGTLVDGQLEDVVLNLFPCVEKHLRCFCWARKSRRKTVIIKY